MRWPDLEKSKRVHIVYEPKIVHLRGERSNGSKDGVPQTLK